MDFWSVEEANIQRLLSDEMEKVSHLARAKTSEAIAKPLTLHHLQAPLYLLPIFLALAIVSFIIEISIGGPCKTNQTKLITY